MTKSSESKWRALISEQERSGLSVREFADVHGITPSTLYWWRSKRKRPVYPSGRRGLRRHDPVA
jgi:transposase-like protein